MMELAERTLIQPLVEVKYDAKKKKLILKNAGKKGKRNEERMTQVEKK